MSNIPYQGYTPFNNSPSTPSGFMNMPLSGNTELLSVSIFDLGTVAFGARSLSSGGGLADTLQLCSSTSDLHPGNSGSTAAAGTSTHTFTCCQVCPPGDPSWPGNLRHIFWRNLFQLLCNHHKVFKGEKLIERCFVLSARKRKTHIQVLNKLCTRTPQTLK